MSRIPRFLGDPASETDDEVSKGGGQQSPVSSYVADRAAHSSDPVIIDCASCVVRNIGCSDCVVTVVLGAPGEFDSEERRALAVLADSGLVPPLRLVSSQTSRLAQLSELPGAACG